MLIISFLKKIVSFVTILILISFLFFTYKYVIVHQISIPLINELNSNYTNHIQYNKFTINKLQHIWNAQTTQTQFRPIPQLFYQNSNKDIKYNQFNLEYKKLSYQITSNNTLKINKGDQIHAIRQPSNIVQIIQIPYLNNNYLNNQINSFYQIKQSLFHQIYFKNQHCLTIQTPSSNTYSNNNKLNRYIALNDQQIAIISLAMNRVIIIQIYSCKTNTILGKYNHIVYHNKISVENQNSNDKTNSKKNSYKFQSFQVFKYTKQHQQSNYFEIHLLTYSKDHIILTIKISLSSIQKQNTISVASSAIYQSHYIHNKHEQGSSFTIENQQSNFQIFKKTAINIFGYSVLQIKDNIISNFKLQNLFNLFSTKSLKNKPSKEQQIPIVVIDSKLNSLIQLNPSGTSKMWKLGKYMKNTRIPVFSNIQNDEKGLLKLISTHEADSKAMKQTNYQFFQLSNKNVNNAQELKQLTSQNNLKIQKESFYSIQNIYPNIELNWLGLRQSNLYFYPQNLLKEQDYYMIRGSNGSTLITHGYKLKGKYDHLPKKSGQIHQKINSKPQQLLPNIYHIHIAYKHLISYPTSEKRVELIHGLNGKPLISYYTKQNDGYINNYIKLQNNQWYINQYHKQKDYSLLTKYQTFTNLTNIHQVLNIKRQYHFPGKIINIYKCFDGFYYLTSINNKGILYFIRVGVNFMNNRMPKDDKKYSGVFQQLMIDKDLSKQYLRKGGLSFQQNIFILNTGIDAKFYNYVIMQKLYFYQSLPYQIFIHDNQGYQISMFNIRNIFIQLIDKSYKTSQSNNIGILILTNLFVLFMSLLLCCQKSSKTASASQKESATSPKKKNNKESLKEQKQIKKDSPKKSKKH